MNHRLATILDAEAANTAGTKTIDINIANPISRIIVQFKGMNTGVEPMAHPAKMVQKIEIVDGSDVIFSLTGLEAQALNYFNNGEMPYNGMMYVNDTYAIATYQIDFGRFLWDDLLAFDPRKFVNPQIKITHNKALGGCAPDAGILSVFAYCYDEKAITPQGFLMSKEQYSFDLATNAIEHIDLATDFVYRCLMVKSLVTLKQPWELYNKIKLTEDNDKRVIFNNLSTSDLLKFFRTNPPVVENIVHAMIATPETVYCTPTYDCRVSALGLNAVDAALYTDESYGGTFSKIATNAALGQHHVVGYNPHGSLQLPFGKQDEIEDWYKVSGIGNLKLNITGGAAVAANSVCEIVSQQLRPYGAGA